jgi:hypothetical protein
LAIKSPSKVGEALRDRLGGFEDEDVDRVRVRPGIR